MSKTKKCAGKEGFQRINYLYQLSNLFNTSNNAKYIAASLYSNLLVNISRKTVQRMEIDMKRSICKSCRCLQLAGITSKVRIKKKNVVWTCLICKQIKLFRTIDKDYKCWTQEPDSLVDIFHYSLNRESIQNTSSG